MDDATMIVEGVANEDSEGPRYNVYIPAATAENRKASARFYYLKVNDGQYLKVELEPLEKG
jgi:hypothetical protein